MQQLPSEKAFNFMNIRPLIIFVLFGSLLVFLGCRADGKKKTFTDWSIPTVKLTPHSKDEKVTPPAEKANAESTANLAHDRMKGHNPTAAIRANDDDPTLRPDPQEIAKLNDFEGRKIPDWATGSLPPAPEASAPVPSERIAQNVNEQDIAAESSNSNLADSSNQNMDLGNNLPDSIELPDSLPGTDSQVAALPPDQSAPTLPSAGPAVNVPTVPQAGDTMTELPGTINGNAVQVSAEVPAQGTAPAQAQAQPTVLFMPGNINPQYPNAPSAATKPVSANPYYAPINSN